MPASDHDVPQLLSASVMPSPTHLTLTDGPWGSPLQWDATALLAALDVLPGLTHLALASRAASPFDGIYEAWRAMNRLERLDFGSYRADHLALTLECLPRPLNVLTLYGGDTKRDWSHVDVFMEALEKEWVSVSTLRVLRVKGSRAGWVGRSAELEAELAKRGVRVERLGDGAVGLID